jgi:hypothetical protein
MIGRNHLIAAGALVLAFAVPGAVMAGQPVIGVIVKGGCNYVPGLPCPRADRKVDIVTVQLNLTRTESWSYDAAKGAFVDGPMALAPALMRVQRPQQVPGEGAQAAVNPIPGIGITVKKVPGDRAAMAVPVGAGGAAPFPKLEDGTYDVTVRVPNSALSARPRDGGPGGVELIFTIVKRGDSVMNLVKPSELGKGNGSPKAQGF